MHVYRFDSPDTATTFSRFLNHLISMNVERTAEIERQLIADGHIETPGGPSYVALRGAPRTVRQDYRLESSDGMSDRAFYEDSGADSGSFSDEGFPSGSDDIEPDLQSLKDAVPFDSVTDELKTRLRLTETQGAAPLLLPPKDYDTIVRRHGDLDKAPKRKCLQIPIVGGRVRNGSDESGIDVPSPTSSEGKNNSMDMSDEKIRSVPTTLNVSTPPVSARNSYEVYPPKDSPMSPRSSGGFEKYRGISRQNSSTSNRSSGVHSTTTDSGRSTLIYSGRHLTEIPPADYDNEAPIMRQKSAGAYSHRDLTRSMPASALQQEMDYGYAVVQKRMQRVSAGSRMSPVPVSPRVDMDYIQPGGHKGVRRTNSMYR